MHMTAVRQAPEPHSLRKSLALHLAPGVLLTLGFLLAAPVVNRAGGSSYLALLLRIPLVFVPFEVGVLLVDFLLDASVVGDLLFAENSSGE